MRKIVKSTCIYSLLLLSIFFTGCLKDGSGELDQAALSTLFKNFTPQYNYTDEPTVMLAHSSQVTAYQGKDIWYSYDGVLLNTGTEEISRFSMFRVGSATKMFTAVIILQLWEEGLIDLDEPFNSYLGLDETNYPKISQYSTVTIRNLLSHRSGVPRISSTTFFDTYDYTDAIPQLERMKYLFTDVDAEFAPGTQYAYRNSNFNILGLVIERVTQKSYSENLHERICNPLGLEYTHLLDFDISNDGPALAHGYTQGFDGVEYNGTQAFAAGGLLSNAMELSLFMEGLISGVFFNNSSTLTLMVTPDEGYHYGLGIFVTETERGTAWGHSGAIFGYNTRLEYFPEDDALIVSTMSFDGYDFMVTNWYDDYCYKVIDEVRRTKKD